MNKLLSMMLFIFIFSENSFSNEDLSKLWSSFYLKDIKGEFSNKIKLYEATPDYRKICFIYNDSVYTFF